MDGPAGSNQIVPRHYEIPSEPEMNGLSQFIEENQLFVKARDEHVRQRYRSASNS